MRVSGKQQPFIITCSKSGMELTIKINKPGSLNLDQKSNKVFCFISYPSVLNYSSLGMMLLTYKFSHCV